MDDQLDRSIEAMGARVADLARFLGRIDPVPYLRGSWRCPRCGELSAGAQDFDAGLALVGGRCVRHHPPRWTLVCLHPACRHVEVVPWPDDDAGPPPSHDASAAATRSAIPPAVGDLLRPRTPAWPSGPDPARRPGRPPGPTAGDAAAAWRQVRACLHHLVNALADLDEAGGLPAAADAIGWKPRRRAKALGLLGLVQRMLGDATRRGRDGPGRG